MPIIRVNRRDRGINQGGFLFTFYIGVFKVTVFTKTLNLHGLLRSPDGVNIVPESDYR
jgi:hypothetical protein